MASRAPSFVAIGHCDQHGTLVSADDPLLSLQRACGGDLGTPIAIPELADLLSKAQAVAMHLSRPFTAVDGDDRIEAWVDLCPQASPEAVEGIPFEIRVLSWHVEPLDQSGDDLTAQRKQHVERMLAEGTARLDADLNVLAFEHEASDLAELAAALAAGSGRALTTFMEIPELPSDRTPHWRLVDGAKVSVPGSDRQWQLHLEPVGSGEAENAGFNAYLNAMTALPEEIGAAAQTGDGAHVPAIGQDLSPVLRQPVTRIIANAETIKSKLAGPLAEEYADYAADIASAGQHLLALIEDLAELDDIEDASFTTSPRKIDLADVARRANGILGGRARDRSIVVVPPQDIESLPAYAEYRRVLQIVLNLLGNAIRYSPEESQIWLRLDKEDGMAMLTVADQGHGLDEEQQAKAFEKFERLGRQKDGGTGLGLYISRALARAMGGDLTVESAPGQGARFTLSIPALGNA